MMSEFEIAMQVNMDHALDRERRDKHHDVLCLVLREILVSENAWFDPSADVESCVDKAREFADFAYPPPRVG